MHSLSEEELDRLAAQVDAELNDLYAESDRFGPDTRSGKRKTKGLPSAPKQQASIEQATGKTFDPFWQEFLPRLRRNLCQPGGFMHEKWKVFKDLDSKTAVGAIFLIVQEMGVAAPALATVSVGLTVLVLTALLDVGIEALCEDCGEDR